MRKNLLLAALFIIGFSWATIAQTPNDCGNYTSTGSSSASGYADPNATCGANVPCTITGGTAAWTGSSCAGVITTTITNGPVSCIVLSYGAVNTNDYGTISTNTGGTLTITAVNAPVNGNVVGPYDCGSGSYGNVEVTIMSTVPFSTVTLTNTGCTSGWVINCADQSACGGGNAGPDSTATICPSLVNLNSYLQGGTGGTWQETTVPASGQFNAGTGDFDGNLAGVGTYTFDYIASGNCSGTDTATITINVVPSGVATWTVPTGLCSNDAPFDISTFVTGTAGGTWSGTGITGTTFDPSVGTQNITYTVGSPPCDDVVTQSISVTPALSPAWTSPGAICESAGTIDLNTLITGDTGGTWSGSGVTGNTFDPNGLSGTVPVTYTIGAAPCTGVSTQDIIVIPQEDPTWVAPVGLCDGDGPVDLNSTVTGDLGGTWSGNGLTGSMFNPSAGTQSITYTVGSAPCQEMLTLTIDVGTTPDPSWTSFTVCLNDPLVDLNATITGTPGGTWSGTGVTGNMFDPSVGPQSITYTVVNGACSASLSQTITGLNPSITVTSTNATCNGLADGTGSVVTTGGSGNYTYAWNTTPPQTTANVSNLPAGTYTVLVTDTDANCVNIDSITIIEPWPINITITGQDVCAPLLGEATANATGGVGGFTYAWNDTINTTANAVSLDSGYHVVTVTDANGCTGVDSILINVYPDPNVTITPDTTIIWGDFFELNATGGIDYTWTPAEDLACDTCATTVAAPFENTIYCVKVIDVNGCVKDTCTTIFVDIVCNEVFVPSAFSPNDDGENDELCVYSDCWDHLVLTIYNRWGEKVYTSSSQNICWDGTWNGKKLNPAVFVYTVDGYLINGQPVQQKGNVSLIH